MEAAQKILEIASEVESEESEYGKSEDYAKGKVEGKKKSWQEKDK